MLTSRGTFQKFFDQQELRNWIDQTLGVPSVPAAPGVFYVFRQEEERAAFMASRYRRRTPTPRLTRSADLFRQHEQLLTPLMNFVGDRGRLPADDELPNTQVLCEVFGSIRRAFRVVLQVIEKERWDQVAQERAKDLLIYLALARFDHRPAFGKLPRASQRDVKEFFSNYRTFFDYGCGLGDDLRLLRSSGYQGAGWDPVHRPDDKLQAAPVVNIGYVINVIEDPRERQEALRRAWELAEQLLIISARLTLDARTLGASQDFADGRWIAGHRRWRVLWDVIVPCGKSQSCAVRSAPAWLGRRQRQPDQIIDPADALVCKQVRNAPMQMKAKLLCEGFGIGREPVTQTALLDKREV